MKKQGVGGIPSYRPILPLPFSVHSSKFRIPQVLCLPLLRKLPGCIPKVPSSELIAHHSPLITRHWIREGSSCQLIAYGRPARARTASFISLLTCLQESRWP